MKRILFTLLILSSVSRLQAQSITKHPAVNEGSNTGSNLRLGLSINPGITLGRYGSTFVLGGELGLYKNLTSTLEGTFSSGLTEFFYNYKDIQNDILIPVKAGVRYTVSRRLFVGAQAGVAFSTTDGGAYFIYSPSVGWKVSKQLDIGVKYDHFSNEPSVLGLNVTYRIDL
ncbi:MAG: hypothetical protein EOO88_34410 [Pedobacter sp.]|nr:MAG: hypothetical protein EOO88_34410 [Pedobacter sp.]